MSLGSIQPPLIDLVYPLGPGSRDSDFELQYSLALANKYITGVRDIYIIGQPPPPLLPELLWDWRIPGSIISIPVDNGGRNPQDCIRHKIETACATPTITDPFLFMNDDYFLRGPLNAPDYPYYYFSNLARAHVLKRKSGHYKRALDNTLHALAERELPLRYYDIHVPIRYHKQLFMDAMRQYDWSLKDGYTIKSLYGNTIFSNPELGYNTTASALNLSLPDVNINHYTASPAEIEALLPVGRNLFSVGQNGLNLTMKEYIKSLL